MANKYFNFLCDMVTDTDEFDWILDQLYKIEFYSLVPNDDNRGFDGEQLRGTFLREESHIDSSFLPTGPCTVLEMLIALSMRMEFQLDGWPGSLNTSECFWMLLENLEISHVDEAEFNDKIKKLLERTYEYDGRGGLFPLKYPKKDQRRSELWCQMSDYLCEKWGF